MTVTVSIDYEALAAELAQNLEWQGTPWMTVAETADYLRASERWVRDRLHSIPHIKCDGKTLINRREIDSWLFTNHRRSASA